jgi:hypothetical protein
MMRRSVVFCHWASLILLTALGQDVRITVKPTRKAVGEMEVVG